MRKPWAWPRQFQLFDGRKAREVVMKYLERIGIILTVIAVLIAATATAAFAQRRGGRVISYRTVVYRPVVVSPYRHYYYSSGFFGHPYYYDPYYYDPYVRERRERYNRENAVRKARRKIAKDRERFLADGILTAKEREKMEKNQRKYAKAVTKLNRFNRNL